MPQLIDERALAPRSIVVCSKPKSAPYSGPEPVTARRSRVDAHTTSAPVPPDDLDQEERDLPRRRASAPGPRKAPASAPRIRRRFHPLFFVGVGLLIMLFGVIALNALGSWWQTEQNDWLYGRPRTYQIDAVVGHHDSAQHPSHFIAMNLNRQVLVIEIPGGDTAHSIVYRGPVLLGPGQDLTPVTLSFQDTHHNGKPEMIMHIAGSEIIWPNTGNTFVPPLSG